MIGWEEKKEKRREGMRGKKCIDKAAHSARVSSGKGL